MYSSHASQQLQPSQFYPYPPYATESSPAVAANTVTSIWADIQQKTSEVRVQSPLSPISMDTAETKSLQPTNNDSGFSPTESSSPTNKSYKPRERSPSYSSTKSEPFFKKQPRFSSRGQVRNSTQQRYKFSLQDMAYEDRDPPIPQLKKSEE